VEALHLLGQGGDLLVQLAEGHPLSQGVQGLDGGLDLSVEAKEALLSLIDLALDPFKGGLDLAAEDEVVETADDLLDRWAERHEGGSGDRQPPSSGHTARAHRLDGGGDSVDGAGEGLQRSAEAAEYRSKPAQCPWGSCGGRCQRIDAGDANDSFAAKVKRLGNLTKPLTETTKLAVDDAQRLSVVLEIALRQLDAAAGCALPDIKGELTQTLKDLVEFAYLLLSLLGVSCDLDVLVVVSQEPRP